MTDSSDYLGCVVANADAGLYDFDKFTAFLGRHSDPTLLRITARHEYLHHELTVSSNYGRLLRRVKTRELEAGDVRYRKVLSALIRPAFTVLEGTATYGSLTEYGRQDLIRRMPEAYQRAFARSAGVIEHSFDSALLRAEYSRALARCSLMAQPSEQLVEEMLAGDRGSLPAEFFPDDRFTRAEEALLSLPRNTLRDGIEAFLGDHARIYLESETSEELTARLAQEGLNNSNLGAALSDTLCEILEDALPGLSESFSDWRMNWMATSFAGRPDWAADVEGFMVVREAGEQRTAFLDRPTRPLRLRVQGSEALNSTGNRSLQRTGTLYAYITRARGNDAPETYIVALDIEREKDPIVDFVPLGEADLTALLRWSGPCTSLIDQDDLDLLETSPTGAAISQLLARSGFVHISGNPIDFIKQTLDTGRKVRWTAGGIAYPSDNINAEHELEIALYAVHDYPLTSFHLSNPSLSGALKEITDPVVGDRSKLEYVEPEEAASVFDMQAVNWLIDHPVVLSTLLYGERRPVLPVAN